MASLSLPVAVVSSPEEILGKLIIARLEITRVLIMQKCLENAKCIMARQISRVFIDLCKRSAEVDSGLVNE